RKWKKTLLVFCLLLAITTLVLSGLAIADAQEEQAEEVRGTTGASFTVERDISTGGWNGTRPVPQGPVGVGVLHDPFLRPPPTSQRSSSPLVGAGVHPRPAWDNCGRS